MLCILLLVLSISQITTYAETTEPNDEKHRVLFLSSYSYSWASIPFQIEGIVESLQDEEYVINYEFMDTKKMSYSEGYEEFYQYLKYKLEARPPYDGIIVGDDAALQFTMLHKEELFPNTPIVFQGIDHTESAIEFAEDPLVTGIVERADYAANLELANKLFPNATNLVLIYDDSENGIDVANRLEEMNRSIQGYEVEYLNVSEYMNEELIERLEEIEADSIVFGISIGEQKGNALYSEDERFNIIADYTQAPIFNVTHIGVDPGMFGGNVIDHKASGYLAGEMMKSILKEGIFPPVELNTPSLYYFDYQRMKQFGISAFKLPKEAEIINKPENFFRKYADWIAGILVVGLIIAIAAYISRRQANMKLRQTYDQLVIAEADLKEQYKDKQKHMTILIEQEAHIRYQAEHDYLTNLPNRRMVMKQLKGLRREEIDFTIILVDLDGFKEINDMYGQACGDKVLVELAQRFSKLMKEDHVYVSRFGGDEFLLVVNELDVDENSAIMTKIQDVFTKPIIYEGIECHVKMRMGIANSKSPLGKASDIVSNADMALHEAKNTSGARYAYYADHMREKLAKVKSIRELLESACEEDGFELLYQPQINVKSDEIYGYEALLRLKGGTISPAEFIPVAEETDLILKIGRIVTRKAIEQLVEWRNHGMVLRPVAINFSTKQIQDHGYVHYLKSLLDEHRISPELIEIEFTESIFMDNDEQATKLFEDFQALGIRMALDDFGTGYSSISYLTYIPVEKIKLDKSIIDIYLQEGKDEFIGNIIRLSHSLGLNITVEGVEEKQQHERLKVLGCDFVQGYYFSKPIPGVEVEKLTKLVSGK